VLAGRRERVLGRTRKQAREGLFCLSGPRYVDADADAAATVARAAHPEAVPLDARCCHAMEHSMVNARAINA
jgi:hypothetical protein